MKFSLQLVSVVVVLVSLNVHSSFEITYKIGCYNGQAFSASFLHLIMLA